MPLFHPLQRGFMQSLTEWNKDIRYTDTPRISVLNPISIYQYDIFPNAVISDIPEFFGIPKLAPDIAISSILFHYITRTGYFFVIVWTGLNMAQIPWGKQLRSLSLFLILLFRLRNFPICSLVNHARFRQITLSQAVKNLPEIIFHISVYGYI